MSKEFYDKYGKLVGCFSCNCIEPCSKSDSPICSEGYVFFAKDKIADLEAKLAEEDEKIERYKHIVYMNMLNQEMLELKVATQNQDKISFAVEKLSDVRSFISDATEIKEPDYTKVCNYIDNQIKQLKEMK